MKLNDLTVDPVKVEDGDWVSDIPNLEGVRLKVRGLGNAKFRKLQARLFDAVPRAKRVGGRLDPDEGDRIAGICMRETVLIDWDGITDDDGLTIPYSKDLAGTLLSDPAYRPFRDGVAWAAGVVGEQNTAADEDDAKNSPPPSAGI